jgi:cysteine-rich repeat protein
MNTNGSFACSCNAGYYSDPDNVVRGLNCIDVDECNVPKYASGLLWEHAPGPSTGRQIHNAQLEDFLTRKTVFTQHEWNAFGIQNLAMDDVVMSAASAFFKPAQSLSATDKYLPLHNCWTLANCSNTVGSFTCKCLQGFVTAEGSVEGVKCMHTSSVEIEHAWATGNKIGLFFSWRTTTIPHPKDVVSIEVVPITYQTCSPDVPLWACPDPIILGERRTIFWMFTGAIDCGSQLTVVVGREQVMDCHVDTHEPVAWSGMVIQQVSGGDGFYYARLYSFSVDQVSATDVKEFTAANVDNLETVQDEWNDMPGGLVECVPEPNTDKNEWDTGAKCRIEIPRYDGAPPDDPVQTGPPIRCGDGKLTFAFGNESSFEFCDDGNVQNGDGCDEFCRTEPDTVCTYKYNDKVLELTQEDPVTQLPVKYYQWIPSENKCVRKLCGDTKINLKFEQCDDGNLIDLDGCSSGCKVEEGYDCEHASWIDFLADPPTLRESETCTAFILELNENDTRADCPVCHELGKCVKYQHRKVCSCRRGYAKTIKGREEDNQLLTQADVSIEPHYCVDVDECKFLPVCRGALCRNTVGSFICDCQQGFSVTYDPGGTFLGCNDDNECNLPKIFGESVGNIRPFPCAYVGGSCRNTPGSFECECASGFNGSGYSNADGCIDLDECLLGTHGCGRTQYCVNYPGSYDCVCENPFFERRGRECFVGRFYEDNKDILRLLGGGAKASSLQGFVREWDLPMLQNNPEYSAGMMQFLVNHQPPNKQSTQWDKFSISPSALDNNNRNAYLHTAIFSKSYQSTPDLGPYQCGAQICHDCLSWDGYPYETKNPQDGGGMRRIIVIDKSEGNLTFRAAASTSEASWTWSFEPKIESSPIGSLWIHWIKLKFFQIRASSQELLPFESLAICRQRTASINEKFVRADADASSQLSFGEARNALVSSGEYQNEVHLEEVCFNHLRARAAGDW